MKRERSPVFIHGQAAVTNSVAIGSGRRRRCDRRARRRGAIERSHPLIHPALILFKSAIEGLLPLLEAPVELIDALVEPLAELLAAFIEPAVEIGEAILAATGLA